MAAPIVRYYASLTETSVGEVERLWRIAKRTASTEGRKHDWTRVSGLLKESLGAAEFKTMGYLGSKVTILDETPDFAVVQFAPGSKPTNESVARTLTKTNGVIPVGYSDLAANRAPGTRDRDSALAESSRSILESVDQFVPKENRVHAMRMILEFEDGRKLDEGVIRSLVENIDKGEFKVDHSDWETAGVSTSRSEAEVKQEVPNLPQLDDIQRAHTMQDADMAASLKPAPAPEPVAVPIPPAEPAPSDMSIPGEIPEDAPAAPEPSFSDAPPPADAALPPEDTSSAAPVPPAESSAASPQAEDDAFSQLQSLRAAKARSGTPVSSLVSKAQAATASVTESHRRGKGGKPDARSLKEGRLNKYLHLTGGE